MGGAGRLIAALLCLAATTSGCGSSSPDSHTARSTTTPSTRSQASRIRPPAVALAGASSLPPLPEPRSGIAAAVFGRQIVVAGGLSPSGTSTSTTFTIDRRRSATRAPGLPGPVHDAAETELAGQLLLFGGGQFEGSNRIIVVAPGTPRQIGTLPQALSDLTAVTIDGTAYVAGGWNGTTTNREIYAVTPHGTVTTAGRIPTGVRYPAVAALAGRVIIAGGETTSGSPTTSAWSFDPFTKRVVRLPNLPAPTDHGAAVAFNGRFYILGGRRNGSYTRVILSWAPGEASWRDAGRLPQPLADFGAVAFDGGVAVIGGRNAGGKQAAIRLLKTAP